MYPDLPLRFIKIHGDILVSYAHKKHRVMDRHVMGFRKNSLYVMHPRNMSVGLLKEAA